jgi:guanosine-3',5'-bis(diphosphate) 3'-pyrophosphohydrolase
LQDLSFQLIYPMRARVLGRALKAARGNRRELLSRILEGIKGKLRRGHRGAQVFGREKSLYSIYRKMLDKRLSFSQVLDVYGFRVVVTDVPTAYLALGSLHALYKPVPGKFKDYIAIPKPNGYQSLHTTLIGPHGTPFEVQIRTAAMDKVAQEGIASHWLYKDSESFGAESAAEDDQVVSLAARPAEHRRRFFGVSRARQGRPLSARDLRVHAEGQDHALPRGATAVDLAYAVHTDIGNHCALARINFNLMPLATELTNGDRVEIVTAADAHPSAGLADARQDRPGAQQDPPLPEDRAHRRVDGARRENAGPGVAGAWRGRLRAAGSRAGRVSCAIPATS